MKYLQSLFQFVFDNLSWRFSQIFTYIIFFINLKIGTMDNVYFIFFMKSQKKLKNEENK